MQPMYDPYEQSYPPSLWAHAAHGGHGGHEPKPDHGTHPAPPVPTPTMSWSKDDIIAWIVDHGIMYDDSATKAELLDLIE